MNDQILFAIGNFFLNIILGPIYAILHWDECKYALFGMIIGFLLRVRRFRVGCHIDFVGWHVASRMLTSL